MSSTKKTSTSFNRIFELFRDGKTRQAIELLYNEHYNKIYGIAFSIVKDMSISEDIVHNTMIRLMSMKSSNYPLKYESTWLYTVVKNEALMFLRKEKVAVSIDELQLALDERHIGDFVDMEAYYSMLEGLNEEQKQIVTLKVLGDYTHKEISKMLHKPIGTVQWIYNIAIKKLKCLLSALFSFTIITGALFIYKVIVYFELLSSYPELPDQSKPYIPFDNFIIVLGFVFVLSLITFILIYLKSYLIPTKATRKII